MWAPQPENVYLPPFRTSLISMYFSPEPSFFTLEHPSKALCPLLRRTEIPSELRLANRPRSRLNPGREGCTGKSNSGRYYVPFCEWAIPQAISGVIPVLYNYGLLKGNLCTKNVIRARNKAQAAQLAAAAVERQNRDRRRPTPAHRIRSPR